MAPSFAAHINPIRKQLEIAPAFLGNFSQPAGGSRQTSAEDGLWPQIVLPVVEVPATQIRNSEMDAYAESQTGEEERKTSRGLELGDRGGGLPDDGLNRRRQSKAGEFTNETS